MKESKFYFFILSAALMLLVLSAAIAFPILFRPFYYAHIAALDLPGAPAGAQQRSGTLTMKCWTIVSWGLPSAPACCTGHTAAWLILPIVRGCFVWTLPYWAHPP